MSKRSGVVVYEHAAAVLGRVAAGTGVRTALYQHDMPNALRPTVLAVVSETMRRKESLDAALRLCASDLRSLSSGSTVVVFNGDFVDRGAHGVEVLSALLMLKLAWPRSVVLLRGNHEDAQVGTRTRIE